MLSTCYFWDLEDYLLKIYSLQTFPTLDVASDCKDKEKTINSLWLEYEWLEKKMFRLSNTK